MTAAIRVATANLLEGGSRGAGDHEFSLLTIGLAKLARVDAPGPQR